MKRKLFTKTMAMVLVLCLLPVWGVPALAAEPAVRADSYDPASPDHKSVNNVSVDVNETSIVYGVLEQADNGGSASVDVETSVTVKNSADGGYTVNGIDASAKGSGSTVSSSADTVKSVSSSADKGNAYGINISSWNGATATGTVTTDVTAEVNGEGKAIAAGASSHSGGTTEVNVGRTEAAAVKGSSTAISSSSYGGGSHTTVVATGIASAASSDTGQTRAVDSYSSDTGFSEVTVNAGSSGQAVVSSSSEGDAQGVKVAAGTGGGTSIATVNGNTFVQGKTDAVGADQLALENGTAVSNLNGDLTVMSSGPSTVGIRDRAEGGIVETKVNGTVDSSAWVGAGTGVESLVSGGGTDTLIINGDVKATGFGGGGSGINASAQDSGSLSEITVNGDVTGNGFNLNGITAVSTEGGETNVEVNGDLSAPGDGIEITASPSAAEGGSTNISIQEDAEGNGGNVDAFDSGVNVSNLSSKDKVDVFVENTIDASQVGVLVDKTVTDQNFELTVWEIKPKTIDGKEAVAAEKTTSGLAVSETVEQSINYIIKIEQPTEGGTIKAVREDGSDLEEKHGYAVANEGQKVVMKIEVQEGYEVTAAHDDTGKSINLTKGADGNYYTVVDKGGAVYLSAELKKTSTPDKPGESEKPGESSTPSSPGESAKPQGPIFVVSAVGGGSGAYTPIGNGSMATVIFDLAGGHTASGEYGPIVRMVPIGTWMRLLDAPVRRDASFQSWATDDESVTVSAPGKTFQVKGDILFTAVWSDSVTEPQQEADQQPAIANNLVNITMENEELTAKTLDASDTAPKPAPAAEAKEEPDEDARTDEAGPSITLAGLEGLAEGLTLPAKLVVDLGGQTLEIPVNIQITLG